MSTSLQEKVIDIIQNSDFNSLPPEERKKIAKYNKEQQILTLWQVLNNYKEYTSPIFRKRLSKWLENCVASYRKENEKGGAYETTS